MASPTTPTHGKMGAMYALRPNGFNGAGLNDLTWGTSFNGAASASFEVEITGNGTPDTFRWRKNGGTWTTGVAITGAEQALSDNQTVTFGSTTGHRVGDKWLIGHLASEACTVAGADAQITDAAKRIINPNAPPVWTDSGGKVVERVNFALGRAVFGGNAGTVTVAGKNGYVPAGALQKVGYIIDWNLSMTVDMAEISRMGQQWKEFIPGMAGGNGGANAYFIATEAMSNNLRASIEGGDRFHFLQLFNHDPDQDQAGDHFQMWAAVSGMSVAVTVGDVVKEALSFQVHGEVGFIPNA